MLSDLFKCLVLLFGIAVCGYIIYISVIEIQAQIACTNDVLCTLGHYARIIIEKGL